MRKRVLALLCALAVAGTSPNVLPALQVSAAETTAVGTTYYISSIHGDNSKDGKSENTAWETLDKLSGITLQPGDQVLLEKGSDFNGYIHLVDVHGTEQAPIKISSYGTGEEKPRIHANGQGIWYQDYKGTMDNARHQSKGYVSSAILLYDVDFVEVSGLEITNESDDFTFFKGATSSVSETSGRIDRTGVAGIARNGGTMQHVYLNDLYIHDVDGNIQDKHMDNGGIQMNVIPPKDEAATGVARYDDVRITNCYVKDVSRAGICVGYTYKNAQFNGAAISDDTAKTYGHTGLVIEGNYVQNAGNDAIVAMYAYRPLVQYNVSDRSGADMDIYTASDAFWQHLCAAVWPWKCKDGVFQYNEVFDTVGTNNQDAQPWDIDYSDGTIYQYNYSHNNGGGCVMFCGGEAYNGVFRYNISQNDLRDLIHLAGNPNGDIYNNVFYIDGNLNTDIFNGAGTANIKNNIFYNTSTGRNASETIVQANRTFANNIFYGYDNATLPDGAIKADPKFADPGKAPTTSNSGKIHENSVFDGYKLQSGSPAINAGVAISGSAKYDFFGNRVGMQPDIGVYESATAETVLAVGANSLTVEENVIKDVPKSMTVAELKENLIYAQDVTLQVLKGGTEAQDDEQMSSDIKVKITRGAQTKEYTIEIMKEYEEYAPTSMTGTVGSFQSGNSTEGNANLALDNNTSTMWHTNYDGCAQSDVWIMLDLGEVKPVAMVKYVPRQGGGTNGIFKKYKVELSTDNVNWTEAVSGEWAANSETKYAKFAETNARYVRLSGLETASSVTGKIFGSAAEVRVGCEK